MTERCKHIKKDGFHTCGSYAFNLYKEDIDQGDLCDVHYWQNKAQRQPLTDEQIDELVRKNFGFITAWQGPFVRAIEAAHGITGEKT
jgi:hypothetical protein